MPILTPHAATAVASRPCNLQVPVAESGKATYNVEYMIIRYENGPLGYGLSPDLPREPVSKGLGLLVDVARNLLPEPVGVAEVLVELLEHDTRVSKLLDCHRTPQLRR